MDDARIEWTGYFRHRALLRGFDLVRIEEIVRYSPERYVDCATGRMVAVGRVGSRLVLVAYESAPGILRPVTAHIVERRQITGRVRAGRFSHE